ncbi:MAG: ABC transporter ATP-binding protein [Cyclobacteriaceae bacterium]|nr:ABC transporter ATP-binding protein [Cyclobacteriaceae bacterium]
MPPQICIDIKNLSKRYKNANYNSLDNINLSINTGDKFGVLGPNGAGKTTLISIICKILPSTSGSIHFGHKGNIKQQIGFVPQDYAFYPQLTPIQNFEYFGALYNLDKKTIKARTNNLLSVLGLEKVSSQKINTFSGGMKRRVNLGIGIIHQPTILLLDEPTVGVDVQSKHAIMKLLDELNQNGTTIIYTSHHLAEAEEFCNSIILIDHGKMIASDSIENLLIKHQSKDLQSLFIQLTGTEYRDV